MQSALAHSLFSVWLALAVSSAACTDDSKIVASCLMQGLGICHDVTHGDLEKGKQYCEVVGALSPTMWSEKVTCDRSAALGGCKLKNGNIIWYYPTEKHTTVDDVKADCKQTFLPAE